MMITAEQSLMALQSIHRDIEIMMASATAHGEEYVTSYTIHTGAIHRIIGTLCGIGMPVTLPALEGPES